MCCFVAVDVADDEMSESSKERNLKKNNQNKKHEGKYIVVWGRKEVLLLIPAGTTPGG
jgi:hypothetical protein